MTWCDISLYVYERGVDGMCSWYVFEPRSSLLNVASFEAGFVTVYIFCKFSHWQACCSIKIWTYGQPSKSWVRSLIPCTDICFEQLQALREQLVQLLFETFNVSGFYAAEQGVLSLYAVGRISGCTVDVGHGKIGLWMRQEELMLQCVSFSFSFLLRFSCEIYCRRPCPTVQTAKIFLKHLRMEANAFECLCECVELLLVCF